MDDVKLSGEGVNMNNNNIREFFVAEYDISSDMSYAEAPIGVFTKYDKESWKWSEPLLQRIKEITELEFDYIGFDLGGPIIFGHLPGDAPKTKVITSMSISDDIF